MAWHPMNGKTLEELKGKGYKLRCIRATDDNIDINLHPNLVEDTIKFLAENNKTPKDVLYITDGVKECNWREFEEIGDFYFSNNTDDLNMSLKVVGDNWWLERQEYYASNRGPEREEYYGSNQWSFKTYPTRLGVEGLSQQDLLEKGITLTTKYYYGND